MNTSWDSSPSRRTDTVLSHVLSSSASSTDFQLRAQSSVTMSTWSLLSFTQRGFVRIDVLGSHELDGEGGFPHPGSPEHEDSERFRLLLLLMSIPAVGVVAGIHHHEVVVEEGSPPRGRRGLVTGIRVRLLVRRGAQLVLRAGKCRERKEHPGLVICFPARMCDRFQSHPLSTKGGGKKFSASDC